jgi:hypothetical protein
MRTLVYKRTHPHDPDECGCFGVEDCMGSVRDRNFDAVIGIGGNSSEAQHHDINGKVNWIGIGPHKHEPPHGYRGPLVTFDHFLLFEADGPDFRELAPNLARRIYSTQGRCSFVSFYEIEKAEINCILRLAESEPASTWEPEDSPDKKQKGHLASGSACSRRGLSRESCRPKC